MANMENVKLLKEAIRLNYKTLDIKVWAHEDKKSPCGTIGCIGGFCDWLLATQGKISRLFQANGQLKEGISTEYQSLLSFDTMDSTCEFLDIEQARAEYMVYDYNWPFDMEEELRALTPGTKKYAELICKRIDQVVK